MTRYLDTSLLVAALTNEAATGRVQTWLSAQDPDSMLISEWVVTEFSSALSIKLRSGNFTADHRADVLTFFARMVNDSLNVVPVVSAHFRAAARIADQFALGLRAGDALHIAVAMDRGATICTLDRKFAGAGNALGAAILLV